MGTQSLSRTTTDPLAAEDSDALTETARQAMVHLRALMSSALPDSSSEPDPITDVITTRRLIAEAWTTHRWETRPTRKPSFSGHRQQAAGDARHAGPKPRTETQASQNRL